MMPDEKHGDGIRSHLVEEDSGLKRQRAAGGLYAGDYVVVASKLHVQMPSIIYNFHHDVKVCSFLSSAVLKGGIQQPSLSGARLGATLHI